MNSTIKLFDYAGNREDCPVTSPSISKIVIEVVSGDEIMTITTKDGNVTKVDPLSNIRRINYFDYSYVIYDAEKDIDVTNEDWFVNRTGSYDVINNYLVTKDYILDYDLSDGTDAYIDSRVINMLPVKDDEDDENDVMARKVMVNDMLRELGFPEDPKYSGWYWEWDPETQESLGLFNEKRE